MSRRSSGSPPVRMVTHSGAKAAISSTTRKHCSVSSSLRSANAGARRPSAGAGVEVAVLAGEVAAVGEVPGDDVGARERATRRDRSRERAPTSSRRSHAEARARGGEHRLVDHAGGRSPAPPSRCRRAPSGAPSRGSPRGARAPPRVQAGPALGVGLRRGRRSMAENGHLPAATGASPGAAPAGGWRSRPPRRADAHAERAHHLRLLRVGEHRHLVAALPGRRRRPRASRARSRRWRAERIGRVAGDAEELHRASSRRRIELAAATRDERRAHRAVGRVDAR